MSEFRIEKQQVRARLLLTTGDIRTGYFFVVPSMTTHGGGQERVGDLLNDEHGFFPFGHEDGTTGQYNRAQVVLVRLPAGVAEEEFEPGYPVALRQPVTMTLSTGLSLEGTVLVGGPRGHERLSDYVRSTKHFWYVVTSQGTAIVNSSHIVELVEKTAS